MKKQKFQLKKYGVIVVIFCAVFAVTITIKAAVNDDATGWLWGGSEEVNDGAINGNETGLGWVSLNGTDSGAGGNYAVNIPIANGSSATGYGWSENMGWIDFNPQANCTTGAPSATQYKAANCNIPPGTPTLYPNIDKSGGKGGVFREGNTLIGWARFVNIAQATVAPSNSGGWDGWIGIGIGNGYGVSIAPDGKLSGYGWSELGAIEFRGQVAVLPVVTLSLVSASPIFLADGEKSVDKKATLTWGIVAGDTLTCTMSCIQSVGGSALTCTNWNGTVSGATTPGTSSTVSNISLPSSNIDFIFQCTDKNGIKSNKETVNFQSRCANKACSDQQCKLDISRSIIADLGDSCPDSSNECSIDGDCQTRSINTWKEVAP